MMSDSEYISTEFRQAAATCQKAVDEARMQNDWKPPNGHYASQFCGMGTGVSEKEGQEKSMWIRLDFRIVDGDLVGREYSIFFSTKFAWKMGELFELAANLSGDPVHRETKQMVAAAEALTPYVGRSVVEVGISRTYDKKSKNEYVQVSFDRILDTVES